MNENKLGKAEIEDVQTLQFLNNKRQSLQMILNNPPSELAVKACVDILSDVEAQISTWWQVAKVTYSLPSIDNVSIDFNSSEFFVTN